VSKRQSFHSKWASVIKAAPRTAKRSKFNAKPQVVDGIRFASQKEARRYVELKMLEKAGVIRGLELQPRFPLYARDPNAPESECIGAYRGDFRYETSYTVSSERGTFTNWRTVVEDVKGFKTPLYRWKKKHVEAQYGIEIREV
jgi:hypothetical protein